MKTLMLLLICSSVTTVTCLALGLSPLSLFAVHLLVGGILGAILPSSFSGGK